MKKPIKPINLKTKRTTNAFESSVADLMQKCSDRGISFTEAFITYDQEYYNSSCPDIIVNLYWYQNEYSQKEFDKKLKQYEAEKIKYDQWLKENKGSIEKANLLKEKARLIKEKEKIEKMLTKYDSL
jgi:hypothetical protein